MKIIDFDPRISSRQRFNVNLGEQVVDFKFSWNTTVNAWFVDFATTEGYNNSVRLVENSGILHNKSRLGMDGDFRVLKFSRLCNEGITYDNFGTDWKMVFGTTEEWREFDA